MPPRTQTPDDFKVPWGLCSEGRLVHRLQAVRGQAYACAGCAGQLRLRGGSKQVHFYHVADTGCGPESLLHLLAKKVIVQTVRDWRDGIGKRPAIVRTCAKCHASQETPVPDGVVSAREEVEVKSGHRVDVALLAASGDVLASVEVWVHHEVDVDKAATLEGRWLEVRGAEIVEDSLHWKVTKEALLPLKCRNCKAIAEAEFAREAGLQRDLAAEEERIREEVRTLAGRYSVPLAGPGFVSGPVECHRCKRLTVVFRWRGHRPHGTTPEPPEACMRVVKWTRTLTHGEYYWANWCLHCGAAQGDHFLYKDPRGPFCGDVSESFKRLAWRRVWAARGFDVTIYE